jgi:hypothetical protein
MSPRVYRLDQPTKTGRACPTNPTPRAHVSRPSPHEPKLPRESRPTTRALTHVTHLSSVLAQLFGATASHFLVLLSHFVIVNSVIFIYNELSHFSYRAQSFCDFIGHTATLNSAIMLEKSAIFTTMN